MNEFELFTMIYFTLDHYWDKHHDEKLGMFLSGMNPFLFEGTGSAVPDIYTDFCEFLNHRKITVENSFNIAKEYISYLNKDYIETAFIWVDKETWTGKCKKYLAE